MTFAQMFGMVVHLDYLGLMKVRGTGVEKIHRRKKQYRLFMHVTRLDKDTAHHHNRAILRPFYRNHPGDPMPEESFWTFMVQGKSNRGRHTDHPAGRHSNWTNNSQYFLCLWS